MDYLLLIVGFIVLLLSGRILVSGGIQLARHLRVSALVIGVTVVSFGTSAPELFVSAMASFQGKSEIAVGNVIGSNIANIALVLAITVIIFPLPVKRKTVVTDMPIMLFVSVVLYLLMLNGILSFFEGLIFIICIIGYVYFSIYYSRKKNKVSDIGHNGKTYHWSVALLLIIISSVGLDIGSHLLVKSASNIALSFQIEERIIAITVLAFGTSLPELATSAIAAFKKEMDISVGNIIGSNIFNILGVLGVSSMINNIEINENFINFDIYWMLGISFLLFAFVFFFKRSKINRIEGIILFLIYIVYVYFLLQTGK